MIQYLIKQTNTFMNSLYEDVECVEERERYRQVWQGNNSLFFIVHYVKSNRLDILEKFYDYSRNNAGFSPPNYFSNILSLIRLEFQTETCKGLIAQLLIRQGNSSDLLKLLPTELFQQLLNYKPVAYERRLKKAKNKNRENRIQRICDSTQGYSEVLLAMTVFLQNGIVKRTHQETWGYILDIVGRHNLDFHKVIDMMLSKIVDRLESPNIHQQLTILENIDFESFLALASKNIYKLHQEWPNQLTISQPIFNLVEQTPLELFEKNIYYYNPKYIQLIRMLINKGKFEAEQFLPHFYCLTEKEILDIEIEKMNAVKQTVNQVYCMSEAQMKPKYVFGQALHCFRFALMSEFIKANDFASFKQLYSAFYPQGRFDIIIHAPLIRQFCLLVDWMIDPLYQNNSYARKFNKFRIPNQTEKSGGYFKQYNQANLGLFEDLQLILSYLQINIGFSVKIYVKLLRVFKIILKENSLKIQWNTLYEFKSIIKDLLRQYLLPAATLHECNPAVSFELNYLLQQFAQQDRFEIYSYYFDVIMFWNPYLVNLLEKIMREQFRVLQALNTKNQAIFHSQLKTIAKMQHNQCFQSSLYLLKRIFSKLLEESSAIGEAIGRSTPFSGDVMMFLALNSLLKCNEQEQIKKLTELIYFILLYSPTDMSFFVQLLLKKMKSEKIKQSESFMKILQFLLNQIFPKISESPSMKLRLEFLTYGYHMKLDMDDKIKIFNDNKSIRNRLHTVLSSKIITSSNTQHSLLYQFIHASMNQINSLLCLGTQIKQIGDKIDDYMEFLANLTHFYLYQTCRIREQQQNRILAANYVCFTDNQFIDLIRDEKIKVPLAIIFRLLRAFKKSDLFSAKGYFEPIPLKKFWQKIYKDYFFNLPLISFQELPIDPAKATLFIHSDFYFFFWTCELENICQLDEVYKAKIDELRRIISQNDIFQVNNEDLQKQNRSKYILTFKMIEKERDQMAYYYQKFNVTLPAANINNKQTHERISKMTIPPIFLKQKDDAAFNDFVSLFFLQCILPRMVIDYSQAIFCSKIIFKIIKENKLPSNKSLIMIFNLLQAAISYIPNSTLREGRCIAVFTSDFLRIFSEWDKMDELSVKLQSQILMQKFNQKRYQKLKEFISHFQMKVVDILIGQTTEPYIVTNCLQFLEKNEYLPLSQGQVERIVKHLSILKLKHDSILSMYITRMISIMESRKKRLGIFTIINYEKQLQKYASISLKSQVSSSRPKIYKQQQVKQNKTKEFIDIC